MVNGRNKDEAGTEQQPAPGADNVPAGTAPVDPPTGTASADPAAQQEPQDSDSGYVEVTLAHHLALNGVNYEPGSKIAVRQDQVAAFVNSGVVAGCDPTNRQAVQAAYQNTIRSSMLENYSGRYDG